MKSATWHLHHIILRIVNFYRYTSLITCLASKTQTYTKADNSLYQNWLRGLFRDLHVLKTAVFLYVCKGVDVLSQVHSESMHHKNSSLARNDWVIEADAAVNSSVPSGFWREWVHLLMHTLVMGLAALAGKVTNSYPALDVKAGIILVVCMWTRVCRSGGQGGQNTQVCLM